jgi:putative metallohydrolase (TIGR04338 family)
VERHFADLPSVQAYLDKVLALAWVRQRWPDIAAQPVVVRERRGAARAHYEREGAVVALPLHHGGTAWALRELVVLHELAHHLGGDADTGHGPAFVGRLVELADGVIGPEAAFLLRVTMADQGVTIG